MSATWAALSPNSSWIAGIAGATPCTPEVTTAEARQEAATMRPEDDRNHDNDSCFSANPKSLRVVDAARRAHRGHRRQNCSSEPPSKGTSRSWTNTKYSAAEVR